MDKIKIEKGTVQETLLIPLYGRKYAMDLYPDLFMDHDCQALFDKIDFTVPDNMKGMLGNIGCIMGATRSISDLKMASYSLLPAYSITLK